MAKGKVDLSQLPGNELRYVPQGLGRDLPIRVASSVVTELSPLVIFMEHLRKMKGVFYEEPEILRFRLKKGGVADGLRYRITDINPPAP